MPIHVLERENIEVILEEYHSSFTIYPEVEKVFSGLDWLLNRRRFGSFVPSMLLTGGTGAGKSETIKHYLATRLSESDVLISRVRPSLQETLLWMVKELNVYKNHRAKGSEIGLLDYVIPCIKRAKLKLLVIEECQELFECASHKERQKIRDRLKMISDECRLPIVFVGIPTAKLILEDSQWDRRIMVKRELPYVRIINEDSIDQYLELLESLEHSLPIPVMPELTDVEIAMRLLAASNGMLGMIKELLAEGVSSAYLSGKTSIQLEDFIHAYEVINGPDVPNPFSTPFDKLMVKQIESYEEYVPDADTGELKFVGQIFNSLSMKQLLG